MCGRTAYIVDLPCVPQVGDIVRFNGYPEKVKRVEWTVDVEHATKTDFTGVMIFV
jgi:hypothetical protein